MDTCKIPWCPHCHFWQLCSKCKKLDCGICGPRGGVLVWTIRTDFVLAWLNSQLISINGIHFRTDLFDSHVNLNYRLELETNLINRNWFAIISYWLNSIICKCLLYCTNFIAFKSRYYFMINKEVRWLYVEVLLCH